MDQCLLIVYCCKYMLLRFYQKSNSAEYFSRKMTYTLHFLKIKTVLLASVRSLEECTFANLSNCLNVIIFRILSSEFKTLNVGSSPSFVLCMILGDFLTTLNFHCFKFENVIITTLQFYTASMIQSTERKQKPTVLKNTL